MVLEVVHPATKSGPVPTQDLEKIPELRRIDVFGSCPRRFRCRWQLADRVCSVTPSATYDVRERPLDSKAVKWG
jgi:hypothetical protein